MRYRYLGSGIYRCGRCGQPVSAKSGRYRCAGTPGSTRGHFTRSSNHIDDSVLRVVHQMLVRPDLEELLLSPDAPRAAEIRGEIAQGRREWSAPCATSSSVTSTAQTSRAFVAARHQASPSWRKSAVACSELPGWDP